MPLWPLWVDFFHSCNGRVGARDVDLTADDSGRAAAVPIFHAQDLNAHDQLREISRPFNGYVLPPEETVQGYPRFSWKMIAMMLRLYRALDRVVATNGCRPSWVHLASERDAPVIACPITHATLALRPHLNHVQRVDEFERSQWTTVWAPHAIAVAGDLQHEADLEAYWKPRFRNSAFQVLVTFPTGDVWADSAPDEIILPWELQYRHGFQVELHGLTHVSWSAPYCLHTDNSGGTTPCAYLNHVAAADACRRAAENGFYFARKFGNGDAGVSRQIIEALRGDECMQLLPGPAPPPSPPLPPLLPPPPDPPAAPPAPPLPPPPPTHPPLECPAVDLWSIGWDTSAGACARWATDSVWGALADGYSLRDRCVGRPNTWAMDFCQATCCTRVDWSASAASPTLRAPPPDRPTSPSSRRYPDLPSPPPPLQWTAPSLPRPSPPSPVVPLYLPPSPPPPLLPSLPLPPPPPPLPPPLPLPPDGASVGLLPAVVALLGVASCMRLCCCRRPADRSTGGRAHAKKGRAQAKKGATRLQDEELAEEAAEKKKQRAPLATKLTAKLAAKVRRKQGVKGAIWLDHEEAEAPEEVGKQGVQGGIWLDDDEAEALEVEEMQGPAPADEAQQVQVVQLGGAAVDDDVVETELAEGEVKNVAFV